MQTLLKWQISLTRIWWACPQSTVPSPWDWGLCQLVRLVRSYLTLGMKERGQKQRNMLLNCLNLTQNGHVLVFNGDSLEDVLDAVTGVVLAAVLAAIVIRLQSNWTKSGRVLKVKYVRSATCPWAARSSPSITCGTATPGTTARTSATPSGLAWRRQFNQMRLYFWLLNLHILGFNLKKN